MYINKVIGQDPGTGRLRGFPAIGDQAEAALIGFPGIGDSIFPAY
jgi:hypothetical protein